MKFLILLIKYNIQYIVNQFLYTSKSLGVDNFELQSKEISLPYFFTKVILAVSLFWFFLTVLAQIFFHGINIPVSQVNFFILSFLAFSFVSFFGYRVNHDFNFYFLKGNFTTNSRKKLILYNEILGITLIYGFIVYSFLPFMLMQPLLNGTEGLLLIVRILSLIFCIGFITAFFKSAYDLNYSKKRVSTKNIAQQTGIIFLCFLSVFYLENIIDMGQRVLNAFLENKISQIIFGFMPDSVNLYYFSPYWLLAILFAVAIILFVILIKIIIPKAVKNSSETSFKNTEKRTKKSYLLVLSNFNKENKIFNIEFLFVVLVILFSSILVDLNLGQSLSIIAIATSTLLVQFLFLKIHNTVNMFNHYGFSIKASALLLLPVLAIQFFAATVFLYLTANISLYFLLWNFFIVGIINITLGVFIGIKLYFILLKVIQGKVLKRIIRILILSYALIILLLTKLVFIFINENLFLTYFIVILTGSFFYTITINNSRKIGRFFYGIYKKVINE